MTTMQNDAIPDWAENMADYVYDRVIDAEPMTRASKAIIARALVAAQRGGVKRAIDWHKKNGRICREIANDDPHFNEDDRRRAKQAGAHHDASAVGLEKVLIDEHAAAIRKLMEGGSDET